MKRIKNELFRIPENLLYVICDDCEEHIEAGDRAVRVGWQDKGADGFMWVLVMHPKCAKDLGGDLAVEIAR